MNKTQTPRQLVHHRKIDCHGYQREDGLWDLEARLIDTKSYSFPNTYRSGAILAGEPIHHMLLRVAIDIDLYIREVEVRMPDTPYADCSYVADVYQQIVGEQIRKGINRKIKALFGGVLGCAHVTELWSVLGTVAYQTVFPSRMKANADATSRGLVGSCHIHSSEERVEQNISEHK